MAESIEQLLTFSPFLVSPSGASENDDIMPAAQLPIGCGQAVRAGDDVYHQCDATGDTIGMCCRLAVIRVLLYRVNCEVVILGVAINIAYLFPKGRLRPTAENACP